MKKHSGRKMDTQLLQPPVAKIGERDYGRLLADIKERVRSAQYEALRAVNKELVALYWDIGRIIVERQTGGTWGKAVVERLAEDLQAAFPGIGGFSASNLWRMKGFYEAYVSSTKLAPLVREIGWSHNLLILERCADPLEREFYIRMTRKFGWSKNVLIHQIENQSYEKTLRGQTNFDRALTPESPSASPPTVSSNACPGNSEASSLHPDRSENSWRISGERRRCVRTHPTLLSPTIRTIASFAPRITGRILHRTSSSR